MCVSLAGFWLLSFIAVDFVCAPVAQACFRASSRYGVPRAGRYAPLCPCPYLSARALFSSPAVVQKKSGHYFFLFGQVPPPQPRCPFCFPSVAPGAVGSATAVKPARLFALFFRIIGIMLSILLCKEAHHWLAGWGCPGAGFVARGRFYLPGHLAGRFSLLHRIISAPVRTPAPRSLVSFSCILAGGVFG